MFPLRTHCESRNRLQRLFCQKLESPAKRLSNYTLFKKYFTRILKYFRNGPQNREYKFHTFPT